LACSLHSSNELGELSIAIYTMMRVSYTLTVLLISIAFDSAVIGKLAEFEQSTLSSGNNDRPGTRSPGSSCRQNQTENTVFRGGAAVSILDDKINQFSI